MKGLDAKLFMAVLDMCEKGGDDGLRIATEIQSRCVFGCGRLAFRIVDADFQNQSTKRKERAVSGLMGLKVVNGIRGVAEFLVSWDRYSLILKGTGEDMSNLMKGSMLKSKLHVIRELEATIEQWKVAKTGTDESYVDALLRSIKQVTMDHREDIVEKQGKETDTYRRTDPGKGCAAKGT